MPQIFKIGSYWIYFGTNENKPLEPIHVHVSQGSPSAKASDGTRTHDLLITNQLLYQLSHRSNYFSTSSLYSEMF